MSESPLERGLRLRRLYDSLTWFQGWRRILTRSQDLSLRKRLLQDTDDGSRRLAPSSDLDDWIVQKLGSEESLRVLDLGCGFGASLLHWAKQARGEFVGVTPVPKQALVARRQARARGGVGRCEFRVQDLYAPIEGVFDVALSVEAMFHASDLRRSLQNAISALAPGGRFLLIEDMARDGQPLLGDESAEGLLDSWHGTKLFTRDDYLEALVAGGMEIEEILDWTRRVPISPKENRARSRRRLERLRRLSFGTVRRLAEAFLGGLFLEDLYDRGRMSYVAVLARKLERTP